MIASIEEIATREITQKPTYAGPVARARARLDNDAVLSNQSKRIRIDEKEGTLVLHGRLPSFYMKQVLQTVLKGIDGVESIDNQVQVD